MAKFNLNSNTKKYKCYVKALRDIEENEEIFLSYIKTNIPVKHRQDHLQNYYFFRCQCPKCVRELQPVDCPSSGYSSDRDSSSPPVSEQECQFNNNHTIEKKFNLNSVPIYTSFSTRLN